MTRRAARSPAEPAARHHLRASRHAYGHAHRSLCRYRDPTFPLTIGRSRQEQHVSLLRPTDRETHKLAAACREMNGPAELFRYSKRRGKPSLRASVPWTLTTLASKPPGRPSFRTRTLTSQPCATRLGSSTLSVTRPRIRVMPRTRRPAERARRVRLWRLSNPLGDRPWVWSMLKSSASRSKDRDRHLAPPGFDDTRRSRVIGTHVNEPYPPNTLGNVSHSRTDCLLWDGYASDSRRRGPRSQTPVDFGVPCTVTSTWCGNTVTASSSSSPSLPTS